MPARPNRFTTTRWSLVIAAGGTDSVGVRSAVAELFETYWYPVYSYVRRQGHDVEDAKDVTQSFFVLLLERNDLAGLDQARGRFRSFLLAAVRHFVLNEAVRRRALKRGGSHLPDSLDFANAEDRYCRELTDQYTPESLFERQWALATVDTAVRGLRDEWVAAGKHVEFDALRSCLIGEPPDGGYETVARTLGSSVNATRVAVHRLRRRFRQRLTDAILETVTTREELEEEIRYLQTVLAR